MYIITSNTSSDIAVKVVQDNVEKVIHLTEKFQTEFSDVLTDNIIFLDSKGIIKYGEVLTVNEETHRRSRRKRSNS